MLEIEEKFPDQRIPRQGRGWLNFLEPGFLQRLNFNPRVGTAVGGWGKDVAGEVHLYSGSSQNGPHVVGNQ